MSEIPACSFILLTDWIIMIAMYREDRNRNIQVWVLIIDVWMTAVFEVLFLIAQELNGHWPNEQTSEANILIKFVICLTSFIIIVLHIKTTKFWKWVLFLSRQTGY
jgi:uncharacterized membrane protein